MPFPALLLPALLGAGVGAATSKNPLQGALLGGAGGALTGGLAGGLGGAANGAAQIGTAAPGLTIASAGAPTAGVAGQAVTMGLPEATKASAISGLLADNPWHTVGKTADMAAQMGMFQDAPQTPVQSAGIPARPADFTGLLSQRPQVSGAQLLMAQRQARRRR